MYAKPTELRQLAEGAADKILPQDDAILGLPPLALPVSNRHSAGDFALRLHFNPSSSALEEVRSQQIPDRTRAKAGHYGTALLSPQRKATR